MGIAAKEAATPVPFWHYAMENPHPEKELAFCEMALTGTEPVAVVGDVVANYALHYKDGTEHKQAMRQRIEVAPFAGPGCTAYAAVRHDMKRVARPEDVVNIAWGRLQVGIAQKELPTAVPFWHYAMENPHPEKELAFFEMALTGTEPLALVGLTLMTGAGDPLRHLPRQFPASTL